MTQERYDSFTRYLAAKKSIDDRALNQQVWDSLQKQVQESTALMQGGEPFCILDVGAGIGTMAERIVQRELMPQQIQQVQYIALDALAENEAIAAERMQQMPHNFDFTFVTADIFAWAKQAEAEGVDLLIAHAFLDLVNIPRTLPILKRLVRPGGLCYLTINFDGITSFEPALDPVLDTPGLDNRIERLYHETMDQRTVAGAPSGDSHSGRHLFQHLKEAHLPILAAGSSDWVVFAGEAGYPQDEAYFLHFIIDTVGGALGNHPEMEPSLFRRWIEQRHLQIEKQQLVYVAHQLDFLVRVP